MKGIVPDMRATVPDRSPASEDLPATIIESLEATAAATPDSPALQVFGSNRVITWSEYVRRSRALAHDLAAFGLTHGDVVAFLLTNRPEFHLIDVAAVRLGCATLSLYHTATPREMGFQLADSGARVVATERRFLAAIEPLAAEYAVELLVIDDPDRPQPLPALTADIAADVEGPKAEIDPDDVICLLYTSGTTGPPKAVEVTHRGTLAMVRGVNTLVPPPEAVRRISYLPAAHIAERGYAHYAHIEGGGLVTTLDDMALLPEALVMVSPTNLLSVPRVWEKLKAAIEASIADTPSAGRSVSTAMDRVRRLQRGEAAPGESDAASDEAEANVWRPLRERFGLADLRWAVTGAAPCAPELIEFFNAIGVPLVETWGMSETSGIAAINPPARNKIGTAGPPIPGLEAKLAGDSELLVRGPTVVTGYRKDLARTADAFTEDGWLRTGDLAVIDADGYVRLIGRKKELIINAAGKNISPNAIEAAVKAVTPHVAHVCVVGDGRPYLVALVVPAPDAAAQIAPAALRAAIQAAIEHANRGLARVEQIKQFALVSDAWPPGGEYVTPGAQKLRRTQIAHDYAATIDALYAKPGTP